MTEYQVDSSVAVPRGQRMTKYPWAEMKTGDSFFMPRTANRRAADNAAVSGRAYLRRHGFDTAVKVVQRDVTENGIKGTRIWFLRHDSRQGE